MRGVRGVFGGEQGEMRTMMVTRPRLQSFCHNHGRGLTQHAQAAQG